ncbi:MAG: hypothetical protein RDU89_07145 [bacterium]|nr:hypothetical protein [bacterium]
MKLSRAEQETIIRFDESDPVAYAYTASRRVFNAMTKAGLKPVTTEQHGWFFEVPRNTVRLKPGRRSIFVGGTERPSGLATER